MSALLLHLIVILHVIQSKSADTMYPWQDLQYNYTVHQEPAVKHVPDSKPISQNAFDSMTQSSHARYVVHARFYIDLG